MAMLGELIRNTRSCRRFYEDHPVSVEILKRLIKLAGMGGSARNVQPLKYIISSDTALNEKIFPHLGWAGYLSDWPGPVKGERPSAYIVCLLDTNISKEAECDLGIATQNILLSATDQGLAGCRIGSISPKLRKVLDLPDHLQIILVIALGKRKESVVLEDVGSDGDIKYWRDRSEVHHVPKRSLDEVIVRTN